MVFIHHSSYQYDLLKREMEKNMSKGRYKYPTTVTSAYNLMLEWQTKLGSIQSGAIKCDNQLEFAQHKNQGNIKRTADIYKNITCYKCG